MASTESSDNRAANQRFIRQAMKAPLLSRELETDLARRWVDAQDQQALNELVQSHTRLVVSIATRYRGYGLPIADLLQEGSVGLMQAASRFDPERGVRFSTYAVWWIRAAIQDFILRNWSVVRVGTTTSEKSLFFNLRRLRAKIGNPGDVFMGPEAHRQIAEELRVSPDAVADMEARVFAGDQSTNIIVGEDSTLEWQDQISDDAPTPEEIVGASDELSVRRRWLKSGLNALPERDRRIVEARHLNDRPLTLAALGEELGISKERVRQLEERALSRLRESILEHAIGMD